MPVMTMLQAGLTDHQQVVPISRQGPRSQQLPCNAHPTKSAKLPERLVPQSQHPCRAPAQARKRPRLSSTANPAGPAPINNSGTEQSSSSSSSSKAEAASSGPWSRQEHLLLMAEHRIDTAAAECRRVLAALRARVLAAALFIPQLAARHKLRRLQDAAHAAPHDGAKCAAWLLVTCASCPCTDRTEAHKAACVQGAGLAA